MPNVPSDEEFLAYNQDVISEFRANQGVVSQPPFPILLLTTTGARTGRSATVPLGFAVDDSGRVFVVASKAGSPRHPAWFHNLWANPLVTVELGDRSFQARAVVTAGRSATGSTAWFPVRRNTRRTPTGSSRSSSSKASPLRPDCLAGQRPARCPGQCAPRSPRHP